MLIRPWLGPNSRRTAVDIGYDYLVEGHGDEMQIIGGEGEVWGVGIQEEGDGGGGYGGDGDGGVEGGPLPLGGRGGGEAVEKGEVCGEESGGEGDGSEEEEGW